MRISQLTVAGFRGFNSPRTIDFGATLTLISAPNSHGKTSIIEALEFLLYGQTSKVESADSKDEYKDSYLNRHYRSPDPAYIEGRFVDELGNEVVLRTEINATGTKLFINGKQTENWPFSQELSRSAKPFVVQHALKKLLLAAPSERFQGFAQILGLGDVDKAQQALVNLCTKPEAHLPPEAKRLLTELLVFDGRLKSQKETAAIAKLLAQGSTKIGDAYDKLNARASQLLGKKVAPQLLSSALVDLRNAAAAKVYSGSVAIKALTTVEQQRLSVARGQIEAAAGSDFLQRYSRLALGDVSDRLRKEFMFLGLGIELTDEKPESCPFCEQTITSQVHQHAKARKSALAEKVGSGPDLGTLRVQTSASLKELAESIATHSTLLAARSTDVVNANKPESAKKIQALFGKGNEHALMLIAAAGAAIGNSHSGLAVAAAKIKRAIEVCEDAIHRKAEQLAQVEAVILAADEYLSSADTYTRKLEEVVPTLEEPSRLLQQAVDAQAGTTELSLLIEVLAKRTDIHRAVRIRETLDSLSELKRSVAQAVGQTMEDAFSKELTGAVMGWYKKIRTTGDPDVHFSGFAMEKTKGGDFKSRKVRVAAESYGVELASAVSSLSESKLNALGLCMSIASALRAPGPWKFLMLDDPVQSWDNDHEVQFIEILRELAEKQGKQIVLMSHRDSWFNEVVNGCRSLGGERYHISGYTKDGPNIGHREWATVDQRLAEALAIANDPKASPTNLQRAEGEIRIAACQLTAQTAKKRLARDTGAHNLNSEDCRKILTEAGCDAALVDRVAATFVSTDNAHHAPKTYEPNAQRIRQYHGALSELRNWLKK